MKVCRARYRLNLDDEGSAVNHQTALKPCFQAVFYKFAPIRAPDEFLVCHFGIPLCNSNQILAK